MLIELYSESTLTELALLGLAFLLSAVIGVERQRKLKSAGLRTHTLVGLGSAVFTLVSAYGFSNVVGVDVVLDPSRIAAQIVSGIGFLGAGVIFVQKGTVNGLTTAASIWMTAAIGMTCGAGMPLIAVAATVLHLLTVGPLSYVGRRIRPELPEPVLTIRYRRGYSVLRQVLETSAQSGYHSALEEASHEEDSNLRELVMRFTGDLDKLPSLAGQLSELDGVVSVALADRVID
ncbi:MgtC/SapB family protein [Microbacterium lushaniae]|nr:MgtC/SapB family protein [Microbacterium lushaniae]KAA9150956.1 MgtC/SapB family protein [Microbacterium lushaniae]